jgi:glycosyltransferase involved in cell wall biosynthesis
MKNLLVLNFFPAFFPPSSGGEQRYYYIYRHLSKHFDVTLLSPTFPHRECEVVEFTPHFREYRIPKEQLHIDLHRALDRAGIGSECSALVCALSGRVENAYHRWFRELVPLADAVIHDSPFMVEYDEGLGKDGKPRIYNSYNVEADLMGQMLEGPHRDAYVAYIAELEARLVRESKLVFATSNAELESFGRVYGCGSSKLALAPNGFEPEPIDPAFDRKAALAAMVGVMPEDTRPLAVFIGSGHPPNLQAARYICEVVAPRLSNVRFAIAGSVCKALGGSAPANVQLLGLLSSEQKTSLFRIADVALNPMFSGAGTNLKMLDYMSSGLPIVTTSIGARGLDVESGRHCIVTEDDAFATVVSALVENPAQRAALGQSARELAYARYTWDSITRGMQQRLSPLFEAPAIASQDGPRKNVLVLNDFSASNAAAGGEVRINHLFSGVAEQHDVTLLCLTDAMKIAERRIAPGFREIAVPKTPEHRQVQREWDAKHHISVGDIISASMCAKNETLVRLYRALSRNADVVVLEHPYMVRLLETAAMPRAVIYEAFNVESTLKAAMLAEHPQCAALVDQVTALERQACRLADRIVCVSPEDRAAFARFIDGCAIDVIENGVRVGAHDNFDDSSNIKTLFRGRSVAVFVGSGHFPNIEAVQFIVGELAPACENITFLIIGSAGHFFAGRPTSANVLVCGPVEEDVKVALLAMADIAVNPMLSGGGSSLKVPEYMAAGIPVVTTRLGVRGYDVIDGVHAIVAGTREFARRLEQLIADAQLRQILKDNAKQYARDKLEWRQLAARYSAIIDRVRPPVTIESTPSRDDSSPAIQKKQLLVVTYRFTDPPMGGAEAFLSEVLEGIHDIGNFDIDVATFDVGQISNHLHFSATYERQPFSFEDFSSFLRRAYKFSANPPDAEAVVAQCRSLFSLWQREDLKQARSFLGEYEDMTLLGGWFHLEQHASRPQRWTGPVAELYCPAGLIGVTLKGSADERKKVNISWGDHPLRSFTVRGRFAIEIALPDGGGGVITIDVEPASPRPDDPRSLGLCVTDILGSDGVRVRDMPLTNDFASLMRASDPKRWVESLVEVTNAREAADDAKFFAVRGPHSVELESWLDKNVARYDIVLAHGVPFSTSVMGVRHAKTHAKPCVVLPHFHMEDKYYHWKHYYEAFQAADLVIAAPQFAKTVFFDYIGATSISVPGGGITPAEFEHLENGIEAFMSLHQSERPFVLVLGRKSGAKNYGLVVDAVDIVNRSGRRLDLVMIGPDEDGRAIDSSSVKYYGNQPRAVVLGALASCLCLANMSDSESFGIVLIEAWMCKKPVVANRHCAAFAELVLHDRNGFLCESVQEVVSALESTIQDPEKAQRLGEAGHSTIVDTYAWSRIAASIDHCLMSLCGDAAAVRGNAVTPCETI